MVANNTYGCLIDGFVPYNISKKHLERFRRDFYFFKILLLSFSIRVLYVVFADERINR